MNQTSKILILVIGIPFLVAAAYSHYSTPEAEKCQLDCVRPPVLTPDVFSRPFASDSIWNRTIPRSAQYIEISDALYGDPKQIITKIGLDIVTVCYSDPRACLLKV